MSAKVFGGNFLLTTSPQSLAAGLGITVDASEGMTCNFTVQAGSTNAGNVYIGGVDMTTSADACLILDAGQSLGEILNVRHLSLANVYVIGDTTTDAVYVLAIQ